MAGLRAMKVPSMVATARSPGTAIRLDRARVRAPSAARALPTKSAVGRGPGLPGDDRRL